MEKYGLTNYEYSHGKDDPAYFARVALGLNLHEGQEFFLQNFTGQKYYLLEPSNQWGKSFGIAIALIWASFYKYNFPGWDRPEPPKELDEVIYNPLYLTPKLRQARSVYGYVISILLSRFIWQEELSYQIRLPSHHGRTYTRKRPLKVIHNECKLQDFLLSPKRIPKTKEISMVPIELAGSRQINFISTLIDQASSTAGDQFPIIFYDECCLDNHLQETLANYLYSRSIRYQAPLILVSTPDQASESYTYFIQLSQDAEGDPDWMHQRGVLTDNIFFTREQIQKEEERLKKLDPELYRQVFYGEHVGGRGTFFRPMEIDRIFTKENSFLSPISRRHYTIGADFASSQNYTVFVILDTTNPERWDLVHIWRCKGQDFSPDYQLEVLIDLAKQYNNAKVGIDASSLAGPLIESRLHKLDIYSNDFAGIRKKELLLALKKAIAYNEEGKIRAPHPGEDKSLQALKRELHTYTERDKGKVKDCVMALGLACWVEYVDEQIGDVRPFEFDIFARETDEILEENYAHSSIFD